MRPNVIQFFEHDRSAIMPIYRPEIVETLHDQATEDGFEEMDDFNLQIFTPVKDISQVSPEEIHAFRVVLDGEHIDDLQLVRDAVYLVNRPKVHDDTIYPRESVIVRAHSRRILQVLGARMMNGFGIHVPTPFLYVTLFTRGDNEFARQGIDIPSTQEFLRMHAEHYPKRFD